ncbi:hypothetical protein [Streptomyces sp. BH104]|uniref:hypothetical protein n=1 Tax=Streptomyces sp. BH104 TaxID=3410407 RepID=UPI003BB7C048
MSPDTADAALFVAQRLVTRHGLTTRQALTAVAQAEREETGEHADLARAEARALLSELASQLAPVREAFRRLVPAVKAAADALGQAVAQLRTPAAPTVRRVRRPAWQSPYGPPAGRRSQWSDPPRACPAGTRATLVRKPGPRHRKVP